MVSIGIASIALALAMASAGDWELRLAIAGGVLLLASCVFVLPLVLAPPRGSVELVDGEVITDKELIQFIDDRPKLQNDVRTALLQALGGAAVLVGLLFTWQQQQATSLQINKQLELTRQGQIGERFSRAVEQLGHLGIDVRLGGLYELEQLSRQAPERRLVIIEVVAAYIREHAQPPDNAKDQEPSPPAQDVAAALTIIGRRTIEADDPDVNLRRVNFSHLNLARARLITAAGKWCDS